MRIVVTGATGNVGSQLVPQLLEAPEVTSVVGIARRLPEARDPQVEWHALDVAEDDLLPAVTGADVVVHLAWLLQPAHDPDEMRRVNLQGTARLLDAVAAAGVPALVHAGSVGAYSPGDKPREPTRATRRRASAPARTAGTRPRPSGCSTASRPSTPSAASCGCAPVSSCRPPPRASSRATSWARSCRSRWCAGRCCRSSRPWTGSPSRWCTPRTWPGRTSWPARRPSPARSTSPPSRCSTRRRSRPSSARGACRCPPRCCARRRRTWRLHLQPTDPGWVDLGRRTPLLDTTRARTELGWTPQHDAGEALLEIVEAMGAGRGGYSPVLRPRAGLPGRLLEVARAVVPGAEGTG